jgi:hypothetical protein
MMNARTPTSSRCWLLHYPDRDPVEVSCIPPATHAEILERYPDAVAAEPAEHSDKLLRLAAVHAGLALHHQEPATTPLTADEEAAIRAWLALIKKTDQATIAEVIGRCQRDMDARAYFLARADVELPKPDPFSDNRRPGRERWPGLNQKGGE